MKNRSGSKYCECLHDEGSRRGIGGRQAPTRFLQPASCASPGRTLDPAPDLAPQHRAQADRKSTRLNSSHPSISYAVFCLKKKNMSTPQPVDILERFSQYTLPTNFHPDMLY